MVNTRNIMIITSLIGIIVFIAFFPFELFTQPEEEVIITEGTEYEGTYSFKGEQGEVGEEIEFVDVFSGGTDAEAEIIEIKEGHKEVLRVRDKTSSEGVFIRNLFEKPIKEGVVEFWYYTDNTKDRFYVINLDYSIEVIVQNGFLHYNDGIRSAYTPIVKINSEKWYHFRIDFNLELDTWDFYLNNNFIRALNYLETSESIEWLGIFTSVAGTILLNSYYDAIGYSWDLGYTIGDNLVPL